jgi:two-component system, NtrC family, response regulator AlgB
MKTDNPSVLVVDDEVNILKTIGICLDSIGFSCQLFSNPVEALNAARNQSFDLAFVDLKMAPMDGLEVLTEMKKISPSTTVVIITAHGTIDSAIDAVKKGAYHYLQKPFDFTELQFFTQKVWEYHKLSAELRVLRKLIVPSAEDQFITLNKKMTEALDLASRVALSDVPVFIEGESGTGKELIAQYIHHASPRAQKKFIKVNCAALPSELLESELFGHVKGAYTGAWQDRQGRFEVADGGTLFLDEITEISPSIQVKLLRVLQSKEYERVGENVTRKVDVRILAATNRNLDEAVKEKSFREDLFYRLNTIRLKLLPLRERPEDIPILLQYFLHKFQPEKEMIISPDAMKVLLKCRWNGNVRELENVVQRAVLLAPEDIIHLEHLPEELCQAVMNQESPLSLVEIERMHIHRVLQQAKDFEEAATILGIDPATLWRKRKKYGL